MDSYAWVLLAWKNRVFLPAQFNSASRLSMHDWKADIRYFTAQLYIIILCGKSLSAYKISHLVTTFYYINKKNIYLIFVGHPVFLEKVVWVLIY